MMDRREVIKEYKNSIQPMGIVQVRNIRNKRVYLTASANTPGMINSIRFQLKMGSFLPSRGLAPEWKRRLYVAQSFLGRISSAL